MILARQKQFFFFLQVCFVFLLVTVGFAQKPDICQAQYIAPGVFRYCTAPEEVIHNNSFQLEDGMRIYSNNTGQAFFTYNDSTNIRIKENTALSYKNSSLLFEFGTLGLQTSNDSLILRTPHLQLQNINAVIVIKTNPIMTRVCVVKGTLTLIHDKTATKLNLSSTEEVAASVDEISSVYYFTDDLRYAWYWVSPEKEPSLTN